MLCLCVWPCCSQLAQYILKVEGAAEAEPMVLEGKRVAQRELGPQHKVTLSLTTQVCVCVCVCTTHNVTLPLTTQESARARVCVCVCVCVCVSYIAHLFVAHHAVFVVACQCPPVSCAGPWAMQPQQQYVCCAMCRVCLAVRKHSPRPES